MDYNKIMGNKIAVQDSAFLAGQEAKVDTSGNNTNPPAPAIDADPGSFKERSVKQNQARIEEINKQLELLEKDSDVEEIYAEMKKLESVVVNRVDEDNWREVAKYKDVRTEIPLNQENTYEERLTTDRGYGQLLQHQGEDIAGYLDWDIGDKDLYQSYFNAGINDEDSQIKGHDAYEEFYSAKEELQNAIKEGTGSDMIVPDLIHGMTPFYDKFSDKYTPEQEVYFPNMKINRITAMAKDNPRIKEAMEGYYRSLKGAQSYVNNVNLRYGQDKAKYEQYKESTLDTDWHKLQLEKQDIMYSLDLLSGEEQKTDEERLYDLRDERVSLNKDASKRSFH